MAVPKRRLSRANTHSRRSQWKSDNVALQTVKVQGQEVMPERGMNVLRGGRRMGEFMDVMVVLVESRYSRYVVRTTTTLALLNLPQRDRPARQYGGQRRDQQNQ